MTPAMNPTDTEIAALKATMEEAEREASAAIDRHDIARAAYREAVIATYPIRPRRRA